MKAITRTVWILSIVSLFTDVASEMLYPVLPIYLKAIGFSVLLIGILEGVAEAMAGLSKGYFGKLSDATGKRVPFVQAGYALSAISKPMMAVFIFPIWVFIARTLDRLGKGIRTGARDAMLSHESTPETKGAVFGFHRSMDTAGAVIGPLFALFFLYLYPHHYSLLFYIAFLPGVLAIFSTWLLHNKSGEAKMPTKKVSFFSFLGYWKVSPAAYKKTVIGFLVFALFNSSDVFLLLRAKQSGLDDTLVIGMYIFYNFVFALSAFPTGVLADRIGLKSIYLFGLALFATVYFGMAISTNVYFLFALFFIYAFYASATDGISKAWVSNIADRKDTATAIGTFTGLQSICMMIASTLTGLFWFLFGAPVAFGITALVTCGVFIYFLSVPQINR